MPNPKDFTPGEELSAAKLNLLVAEIRRLGKWRDSPTVLIEQGAEGFSAEAVATTPPMRVYWTTSAISSASVAGTTVSTAKRTLGPGTARICTLDTSGRDIPDVNAADDTIYNDVVMTGVTSINTAMFCDCEFIGGVWRIVSVHRCPS